MSAIIIFWLGLAAALVYLAMADDPPSWPRSVVKTIPLLTFALAAALAGGPILLIVGLLLSAIGDYALSRQPHSGSDLAAELTTELTTDLTAELAPDTAPDTAPERTPAAPGQTAFLAGLTAFALAHIAYAVVFLAQSGLPLWAAFFLQPVLALFLLFVLLSIEIWLVPYVGALRWPVRVYALAIGLMGIAALTQPMGSTGMGALYFIGSDVLLAAQIFRVDPDDPLRGRIGWFVWGFYIAGQALILAGTSG